MSQQAKLNQLLELSENFLKILKNNKTLVKKYPNLKTKAKELSQLRKYAKKSIKNLNKQNEEIWPFSDEPCTIDKLIECIEEGVDAYLTAMDDYNNIVVPNIKDMVANEKDLALAKRVAEVTHKLIDYINIEENRALLETEIANGGHFAEGAQQYLTMIDDFERNMNAGLYAGYISRTEAGIKKSTDRAENQLKKPEDDPKTGRTGSTYKDMSTLPIDDTGDGISPDDPVQGATVGNCFLISTLSALANSHSNLLKKNIKKKKNGIYEVTLYIRKNRNEKRKKTKIKVDADFPVDANGDLIFTGKGDNELWAMLFEKAYAKAMGGYDNIDDGGSLDLALQVLTGKEPMTKEETVTREGIEPFVVIEDFINLNNDTATEIESNLTKICNAKGIPTRSVTLGSMSSSTQNVILADGSQLIFTHAYSLKKWDGTHLHLRNPHGQNDVKITIQELQKYFVEVAVL